MYAVHYIDTGEKAGEAETYGLAAELARLLAKLNGRETQVLSEEEFWNYSNDNGYSSLAAML